MIDGFNMELHVLRHRLHIASMQKKDLDLFSHSLIKLTLLHQHTSCKFFSFTETCDDFSVIIDEHGFSELPSRTELMVQPTIWLVLNAIPSPTDADGNAGLTKTTKSLIMLLADQKISIYSLSTYQTDFVLVREEDYDRVVWCLQPHFAVFWEQEDGEMIPVALEGIQHTSPLTPTEPKSPRPIVHYFQSPDNHFLVTSLQPELLSHISIALLQLMFYSDSFLPPPKEGHERFLSLSIINDRMSLVVDTESLALFPPGSVCTGTEEYWRMIKIGNLPLGFDESGIAAQISEPLAEDNIPMYYISTFLNDHTLVSELDIDHALSILKSKQGHNVTELS
ncbi:cytosolic arginine sensor for mTORC1 subunit 2-like isoform X2 [Acanthaster planci]|nr:cytosolic arginine sensor for mTORC1 subunit 2-like isoform X2 [Acanthaster planci]XP_022085590.1 cytosolic arginine sensor for mTORC1 subunit 2-like isoform X2 [Acanthaster planci]XP_022085591.1 cytosolic arginine sensor for mTORC1 subunit 2-like isoform X2 [Acanthaster planci]